MTNGRGFMGMAAMFFGAANPIFTTIGCLICGFTDSVGARLQAHGFLSQFVFMLPYIITISILSVGGAVDRTGGAGLLDALRLTLSQLSARWGG